MRQVRKRAVVMVLAGLAVAAAAGAQGIRVTIDRTEATVQDQLVLNVVVEGSRNARPRLPDLSAFQVYDAGQSTQFNMINGRTSTSINYRYVLVPLRTGTFTIGAATVEIDGRRHQSQPFRVRILEASEQPREAEGVFLRATVSTTTPYVGQQVIYVWRFYRRVQVPAPGSCRWSSTASWSRISARSGSTDPPGRVRSTWSARSARRFSPRKRAR